MLLNISQHSELTLQEQIANQLRARILSGELEPDQALTSIRGLAQSLKVGINTVQRAYEHLLGEELIYARQGKGFFVTPLDAVDKTEKARARFDKSLSKLLDEARREGLDKLRLKQIITARLSEIFVETTNADA